ncbi:hypothetical protein K3495_g12024 [Podosphaera aphanis]|nr:hypothetical protein K3495_g12024 [Podosphaera aphanis]
MTNLISLTIYAPENLSTGIGYLFNGPFDLPNLKLCKLFYECWDGDYWDMRKNIHVFSHPTLEHLSIRRAKLDSHGLQLLEKPERTALQTLQLLECDMSESGFFDIMTCPAALKEITLTQLKSPDPPLDKAPEVIEDYTSALAIAEYSLEKMVLDFPSLKSKRPMHLRRYNKLTRLELYDYQLFSLASPRFRSISLPPNLKLLKLFNQVGEDETVAELLSHTIKNKDVLAKNWTKMIVEEIQRLPLSILRVCKAFDGFLTEEKLN